MAFGKPGDSKRIKNAVLEDQLVRTFVNTEERNRKNWTKKWKWILDEYNDLHKKLNELSKDSQFLSDVNKNLSAKDERSIKPIPATTNHQYGWIPSLEEFRLEKYGPDYDKGLALPPHYHIFKGF